MSESNTPKAVSRTRARLLVTLQCGWDCVYCRGHGPEARHLPWDEAVRFVEAAVVRDASSLVITGGEPTFYPQLVELVAHAARQGLPEIVLETSGQGLTPELARNLREAGLTRLLVSIRAFHPAVGRKLTGGRGEVATAQTALALARAVDLEAAVRIPLLRQNAGFVPAMLHELGGHRPP
jgi:GTP 3',8-cyclase